MWKRGITLLERNQKSEFQAIGKQKILENRIAYCLLAGGQGTRLNCSGPKGFFKPDLPLDRSLFQIHAERLLGFGTTPEWFLLTSYATDEETRDYFKNHNNFGYPNEKLHFVVQDSLPCLNIQKEPITLNSQPIQNPNGSGGVISALYHDHWIQYLIYLNIDYLILYNIDNLLVSIPDPTFVGWLTTELPDVAAKAIQKKYPDEAVGVFAQNEEGKPIVYEYTDTPRDKIAEYTMGNAGIYAFSTQFLQQIGPMGIQSLPLHYSWKKISHDGDTNPKIPNAWKTETFIFDWFLNTTNFAWYEIDREEEFAPIKNANFCLNDSPATAKQLWNQKWIKKLRNCGAQISNIIEIDISGEAEHWTNGRMIQWIQIFKPNIQTKQIILQ